MKYEQLCFNFDVIGIEANNNVNKKITLEGILENKKFIYKILQKIKEYNHYYEGQSVVCSSDDIYQEYMLKICEVWDEFKDKPDITEYKILQTAANRLAPFFKQMCTFSAPVKRGMISAGQALQERYKLARNPEDIQGEGVQVSGGGFEDIVINNIVTAQLLDCLEGEVKEMMILHFVDGLKVQDVAKRFGLKPNSVTQKLKRAKEQLKAQAQAIA